MSRQATFSFAEKYPELLKYWDYEKNELDPNEVGFASHKTAYFKCEHGHSFQANIDTFGTRTYKCPICKKKSQSIANRPEVMKFWDYEKKYNRSYNSIFIQRQGCMVQMPQMWQ